MYVGVCVHLVLSCNLIQIIIKPDHEIKIIAYRSL